MASVARELGVTSRALHKACLSGRCSGFTMTAGRVRIADQAEVMRTFHENRNAAQDRHGRDKPNTITAVEIRLKEARARRAEQETEQRAGNLLVAVNVRRAEYEVAKIIRENLDNIPDRLGDQLAVERDPVRIRAMLAEEIRRSLEVIADRLEQEAAAS